MRTLTLLLIGLLPLVSYGQDGSYVMYESVMLTPDNENLAGLSEAMSEHNNTYHKEGPYRAVVWEILNGPNTGTLVWMMGPCTFTDLDSRPQSDGDHDNHWMTKVMPHIENATQGEYWRRDEDLSYIIDDPRPLLSVRFLELNMGQGYRLDGLLKKVSDAVKAIDDGTPWSVFYNEFQQGKKIGRHIAMVSSHKTWSEFDEDDNWVENYEKHHGEGSWETFMREWNEVISDSWDEIWVLRPEMSAPID